MSAFDNLSGASRRRAARSLEARIAEHESKLDAYRRSPDAYDEKGFLKNAPNEEARQRIIEGRIRHLEHEIETFKNQLAELKE